MKFNSIDEYINSFEKSTQEILNQIRFTISKEVPDAQQKISYNMPTFYLNGNLIHFAAHKNHIGIYPGPKCIEKFKDKLSCYKTSKGCIQIPLTQSIPYELIKQIVSFIVLENKTNDKPKPNKV